MHIHEDNASEIPRTPIRFTLWVAKRRRRWVLPALFFTLIGNVAADVQPYFFAKIIDAANQQEYRDVWIFVSLFLVLTAVIFAGWRTGSLFGKRAVLGIERDAHMALIQYLFGHSHGYFTNRFSGAVSQKISNAADGAEHLSQAALFDYIPILMSFVVTFILVTWANVLLGVVFFTLAVVLIGTNWFFMKPIGKLSNEWAGQSSKFRGGIVDAFSNIVAVRQFARKEDEFGTIGGIAQERMRVGERRWTLAEYMLITNNVIVTIAQVVMFAYATYLWSIGDITVGTLIMVLTLMLRIQGALVFIGNTMRQFVSIYGQIKEGLDEILVPHEILDREGATDLVVNSGSVKFDSVSFNYEGNPVFSDLSFTLEPGQKVGLVGPSGAGKTTLVSLLLRQHDLQDGSISIDGQDIKTVTQDSLRRAISVVPQDPALFHRTIRENIAYGKPDATDEEVVEAAKMAQAHDFISTLSEGYDTLVGERGVKLSGGQRQRVAIARAMLKNAPILVLDEATSSLDSESEVAIQKALHILMEGKTVVAIAHRLSTLREMDRILVLENGQVVEDGSHGDLVTQKGTYARLWEHQAGGFLQE